MQRPETLRDKPRDANTRLTFCTTYTPYLLPTRIRHLLNKHWHLIEDCHRLASIFPDKPKLALRTHRSTRQMLVRAHVEDNYNYYSIDRGLNALRYPLPAPGDPILISKCNMPRCQTCPHFRTTPYVCSLRIGTAHNLHSCNTLTCTSKNTVYVIACTEACRSVVQCIVER